MRDGAAAEADAVMQTRNYSRAACLPTVIAVLLSSGCYGIAGPDRAACEVLSTDDIAQALRASEVRQAEGSGANKDTGIDTCRWTTGGNTNVELSLYRADSSAQGAWKLVFESARAHATKPDATGRTRARTLTGVGDDAMVLAGTGRATSIVFLVGRTGAMLVGTGSEDALIELAKRAAERL